MSKPNVPVSFHFGSSVNQYVQCGLATLTTEACAQTHSDSGSLLTELSKKAKICIIQDTMEECQNAFFKVSTQKF